MQINFRPFTEKEESLLKPVPAITSLPDWYKKLPTFTNNDKKERFFADGSKNLTIKRCNPVGDALGFGYFLVLENTVYFEKTETDTPNVVWSRGGDGFVTTHTKDQVSPELIPEEFSPQPFKFLNNWSITTPKGYSVLITHPLNRNSEPFLILSGVVDTDTFNLPINLPFLIKKDFEGMIEAGTPIAQVIPFKRETWKSNFIKYDEKFFKEVHSNFYRIMHRYYKRFHWKRKEFK